MKKRTAIVKAIVMALVVFTFTGQCFAGSDPFRDIDGISGKEKIVSLAEHGLVNGTGNGLFEPQAPMTAAQGIQLLVNAFGLNIDNVRFIKEPKASDYFKKAADDAWYSEALIIAAVNGLEFPPDLDPRRILTREEFVYYLVATMEKQGGLPMINLMPVNISDETEGNVLYSGAIQRALHYNLTELDSNGAFRPKEPITRCDAAVQVYNALQYLRDHPAPTAAESLSE